MGKWFKKLGLDKIDSKESERCQGDKDGCRYNIEHDPSSRAAGASDSGSTRYANYPTLIKLGSTGSDEDDCKNIGRRLGVIKKVK